ncbi:MAG: F0F1 ATP synthase subunit A [Bdellovibrionaceae bacterium]|nr:F0F1 ATP synthase subunit A [Pseudobdellovibrionaceae bacterium]NUM59565.1 F0F1 ATP synthase subunit A [Pseudobdellovibrionaceae bacterium]
MSFNWTQLAVGHENVHIATLGLASVVSIGLGLLAKKQLGTGEAAVIPAGKFSLRGLFEVNVEFISKLANSIIGHDGYKYVPYFSAMFGFILINNLIGVIPGMTPATENINTTFAFGIFSFLSYNFIGLKKGGSHYLAHFLGPIWWLAPLMLVIEIIAHFIRPLTLGLRLANVMTGDHTVLSVFLGIVPYPLLIPIPFYVLGLLVCFIQAFVFTLLSMVYVALAQASDH